MVHEFPSAFSKKVWHKDFERGDLQRLDFYMRLYELRRICQRRFPKQLEFLRIEHDKQHLCIEFPLGEGHYESRST